MSDEITVWRAKAHKETLEKKIEVAILEFCQATSLSVSGVNLTTIIGDGGSIVKSLVSVDVVF